MKLPDELQFIQNARLPQKTTTAGMDGKVCVITGATSGVGYQTAKRLAQAGANIVMVCRNEQKALAVKEELQQQFPVQIDVVLADFSRLSDVRKAAETINNNYSRLDVLINNAGVHHTHRTLSEDGFEMVFAVNHLASFLFTRLLLEKLIASAPARIIQVNSQGHRFGGLDLDDLNWDRRRYRGLQSYGASKVAQMLTVWELSDRLTGSGVTINAVHPGEVRSNIGMNNERSYRLYKRYLLWWILKDPSISAEAIYYHAAAPEMADVSGKFFNLTIEEKPAAYALDRSLIPRVWKISEEMTGLSNPETVIDQELSEERSA
ncbi:MAG: SDR family oxidoreductase [Anaerolineaceae bacterium]|nr:SDR family oxidoreductase [Anaerolineaceae bacterium]MDD4042775.1 SDR family oxidoreductase [Anaerolineaceae bacterium]MDD4577372.1 SDR family oxidoreductase [Anaerolineaceae bacterium]